MDTNKHISLLEEYGSELSKRSESHSASLVMGLIGILKWQKDLLIG